MSSQPARHLIQAFGEEEAMWEVGVAKTDWPWQTPVAALLRQFAHGADPKRLQQFACACCRRVEHLLCDGRSRRALEVAAQFAVGQATEGDLLEARQAADFINHGKAHDEYAMAVRHAIAAYAAYLATRVQNVGDAAYVAHECCSALIDEAESDEMEELQQDELPPMPDEEYQCQLARAMFGPKAE
jgi:hypothetical protein